MNIEQMEHAAIELVSRVAPWLAPLPTAYLVGRATILYLHWPVTIGVVAAIVIECLGLTTISTALTLRNFNRSKRKSDPAAPVLLAVLLIVLYYVVATGLTVALDTLPELARFAPAIFPTLSLAGASVLAIRASHAQRLADIEADKARRRRSRLVTMSHNGHDDQDTTDAAPYWRTLDEFLSDADRPADITPATLAERSRRSERTARRWLKAAEDGNKRIIIE